jgi:hypothetical protein
MTAFKKASKACIAYVISEASKLGLNFCPDIKTLKAGLQRSKETVNKSS